MKSTRIAALCAWAVFGAVGLAFAGPPRDNPIVAKILEVLCGFLPWLPICS